MASENRIEGGEEVLLICSPEAEKVLRDRGYNGYLVVATWVEGKSCVIVRKEDWENLISSGEVWGTEEE